MDPKDFDPAAYYAYYTEGNGWQWTWSVFQDVTGLIEIMGGRDRFNRKLDAFFAAGSEVKAYEFFSTHIGGMIGQYAHGNEPSHHVAYLYDYSGEPWKTQMLTRQIMDNLYKDLPAGLAGNEDMGQMSAWYVFSALGLYPLCPGVYLIGSPLFERAELGLEDGSKLIIEAENVSSQNIYIQSAFLNGAPLTRPWLSHAEIARGALIHFVMGPAPNPQWGSSLESAPPSWDQLFTLAFPSY
jgi:predicted alpha-1,2-mannosidase